MGKYIAQVGKYSTVMGDWVYDYLKQKQPLEYYQKQTFDVEVKDRTTGKKYNYDVPVTEFVDVKLLKKNYEWEHKDCNTLFLWLFNSVIKKEELFVKVYLSTHWGEYPTKWKDYFLQSELGEAVILGEKDKGKFHKIETVDQLDWIYNKGLQIDWVNEKGEKYEKSNV